MSDRLKEIKIQELKNMFFYTFGIVPLDNYDVVGDGLTDNRLAIQQAIYDAIEVGTKYIFVTKGEYYYNQTLNKADEVIFIGNNTNTYIRDIEIRQFPDMWNESQASTGAINPIGSVILYAGKKSIPKSYLECNGQKIKTRDYSALYSVLNNVDLSTVDSMPDTFPVPNLATGNSATKYIIRAK